MISERVKLENGKNSADSVDVFPRNLTRIQMYNIQGYAVHYYVVKDTVLTDKAFQHIEGFEQRRKLKIKIHLALVRSTNRVVNIS